MIGSEWTGPRLLELGSLNLRTKESKSIFFEGEGDIMGSTLICKRTLICRTLATRETRPPTYLWHSSLAVLVLSRSFGNFDREEASGDELAADGWCCLEGGGLWEG